MPFTSEQLKAKLTLDEWPEDQEDLAAIEPKALEPPTTSQAAASRVLGARCAAA